MVVVLRNMRNQWANEWIERGSSLFMFHLHTPSAKILRKEYGINAKRLRRDVPMSEREPLPWLFAVYVCLVCVFVCAAVIMSEWKSRRTKKIDTKKKKSVTFRITKWSRRNRLPVHSIDNFFFYYYIIFMHLDMYSVGAAGMRNTYIWRMAAPPNQVSNHLCSGKFIQIHRE